MTPSAYPLVKDVVLIGGGHAHALLLRAWGMKPVAGARLTLVNPAPSAPYTGMLPGHVAGHYERDALEIDLVRLARHAGARLVLGRVEGIDRSAKRLFIEGRPDIPYDIASFDIGITSDMPDLPGFSEHGVSAKPLGPFAARWRDFLAADTQANVAIIGGGVAGIELALAMQHRLGTSKSAARVSVIEAEAALRGLAPRAQAILRSAMQSAGIVLHEHARVSRITDAHVHLDDGKTLEAGLVVGAAGARPFEWLQETGLTLTDGFIAVDATLRAINDPNIYAAGDCAHLTHAPRPKAGVFAVRAAPILTHNIRADLTGGQRKRFQPQSSYLKLISLGEKSALTDKWGVAVAGNWVWSWKDHIDQAFMDRLSDLPPMKGSEPKYAVKPPSENDRKPLCGGCGAKVSSRALKASIANHLPNDHASPSGPGDDAAVITVGGQQLAISTDHLRAFWDDPYVMSRIAAVHALGDIWSMGATPQTLLAQIILPRMDARLQSDWLDDIMAGAVAVASAAGAEIVGGHTSMGAELTIGFTATGILKDKPLTLSTARAGDTLILSRPIGSGTILAGDMAGKAAGRDVADALHLMATPQGDAARRMADDATSMTDVTGFGLAGHLASMADASRLTAHIDLSAVPCLSGALKLAEDGVRSTLFESNRDDVLYKGPDTPLSALLFDPQTAGGFLAAVPEKAAEALLSELQRSGHSAAAIGRFEEREDYSVKAS